jgi:hypothetical protein
MAEKPETPELNKRSTVLDDAHKIGEFLDWLSGKGIWLARYQRWEDYRDEMLTIISTSNEQLLADYFVIDLLKIDQEQKAILEWIRSQS